jgi:transcriptional regulator with GAF, ATPase, and Fis domain
MDGFVDAPLVVGQWAAAFRGLTAGPTVLDGESFSEEKYLQRHEGHSLFEMFLWSAKLSLCVIFGEYGEALRFADRAERCIRDYHGTIWDQLCVFHRAIALAATALALPDQDRGSVLHQLRELEGRLAHWAKHCPENFCAQHLIVAAELARIGGTPAADVAAMYEEAIAESATSECPRERAIANELCSRFWLDRHQHRVAAPYLVEARAAWAAWGAEAKVRELDRQHAVVLGAGKPGADAAAEGAALDFATAMKAARAIAQEIERPSLLRSLLRIAMENAGAERGLLLRDDAGLLVVAAEGRTGDEGIALPDAPASTRDDFCLSIVQLVQRTGESVLIADARADERWLSDEYIRRAAARSILCIPLVQQGTRPGLLYLENNLAAGAFGGKRGEVLQILASHAGVALENARLYEALQKHRERLLAENTYLQEEIQQEHNFEEIIGRSPALLETLAAVDRVARTEATVLILGETGVGKELVARAIHSRSPRRERPLVKVNCGAIAAGLVESELFGHVKGAFTGALQKRVGRFELADSGTIFLDEVGELALDAQVKLLRVLQERELEPVGSSRTVKVDVRVIAATNRDLSRAVREGRFRADLLYRLNVFPVRVPPLRERPQDIPMLIAFFRDALAKRLGKPIDGFARSDMQRLMAYAWPGNVRELQNVVERAGILAHGPELRLHPHALGDPSAGGDPASEMGGELETLEAMERSYIARVLESTGGVIEGPRGAARVLGLNAATLRSRMKKLGVRARPSASVGGLHNPGAKS